MYTTCIRVCKDSTIERRREKKWLSAAQTHYTLATPIHDEQHIENESNQQQQTPMRDNNNIIF